MIHHWSGAILIPPHFAISSDRVLRISTLLPSELDVRTRTSTSAPTAPNQNFRLRCLSIRVYEPEIPYRIPQTTRFRQRFSNTPERSPNRPLSHSRRLQRTHACSGFTSPWAKPTHVHALGATARPTGGRGSDPDHMHPRRGLPPWVWHLIPEDGAQEIITPSPPLSSGTLVERTTARGCVVEGGSILLSSPRDSQDKRSSLPRPPRRTRGCSHQNLQSAGERVMTRTPNWTNLSLVCMFQDAFHHGLRVHCWDKRHCTPQTRVQMLESRRACVRDHSEPSKRALATHFRVEFHPEKVNTHGMYFVAILATQPAQGSRRVGRRGESVAVGRGETRLA